MTASARERTLSAMALRELVHRVAARFETEGIDVAVLKGALLQQLAYDDPAERTANDLDLLVASTALDRADRALGELGLTRVYDEPGDRERVFRVPGSRFVVDLHREMFFPGQFSLAGAHVLARARRDTKLFDAPVLVPDPLDLFAHLVGHFALTWLTTRARHHPHDLEVVAHRFALDAPTCARKLVECRMDRAARYALPLVGEPFATKVLEALPRDSTASLEAKAVLAIVARLPPNRGLGLLPPKLLHRSPGSAVGAVLRGAMRRVRRRLRYSPRA